MNPVRNFTKILNRDLSNELNHFIALPEAVYVKISNGVMNPVRNFTKILNRDLSNELNHFIALPEAVYVKISNGVMKAIILAFMLIRISTIGHCEEEKALDQQQVFYMANTFYAERNYPKALESYQSVLNSGLENGALYYNMGNCYFKMGKLGYAILYYDKARRLMPQDSDLVSNLSYAKQQLGDPNIEPPSLNIVSKMIKRPYAGLNLNAFSILSLAVYVLVIAMSCLLVVRPFLWKKLGALYIIVTIFFAATISAFALRYYDEEILKRGVVVQKTVEAKYEPIDKSTTYYNLQEGGDVFILATRDDWRQVRRPDGKVAWVPKTAVEEV
jgi:tetratricopeptide (TPR) repeat protein